MTNEERRRHFTDRAAERLAKVLPAYPCDRVTHTTNSGRQIDAVAIGDFVLYYDFAVIHAPEVCFTELWPPRDGWILRHRTPTGWTTLSGFESLDATIAATAYELERNRVRKELR